MPRIHARAAVNHLNALRYARGGQLPFILFDAIALSEDEARQVQEEVNARRAMAEALAQATRR